MVHLAAAGEVCPQVPVTAPQTKPAWELADIFRLYGEEYRQNNPLPSQHLKVMHLIEICRTAALGGHIEHCDSCGYEVQAYNSCRNRHCPKCQTLAKERWLQDRKAELIPTGYFHVVFTLPHDFNPIVLCNKRIMLNILFASVNETLQDFAHDPQWHLEGQLGFIAVLHTWSQTLIDHFHLHCVIPGGVLQKDKTWKPARETFLFATSSLAKEFRNCYSRRLKEAYENGELIFPGKTAPFGTPQGFSQLLGQAENKKWIVYAKRPFAGPEQVLEYLGRYTHRVAISNHRIVSIQDGKVTFTYKDRSDKGRTKLMTLEADKFIRRFLLHILPVGYMKIRHFGFLANTCKKRNLECIHEQLGVPFEGSEVQKQTVQEMMLELTGEDISLCPRCGKGHLVKGPSPLSHSSLHLLSRERFDSS